jgi:hypothetical protein
VLTNSGIPKPEIDDYHDGWNNSFDNLTAYLSRPDHRRSDPESRAE